MRNQLPRTAPLRDRLFFKTDITPGCWLWTGNKARNGYGLIRPGGNRNNIGAHRASWLVHFGEIPDGLFVCHDCDVRLCVNPDHLFLGTQKVNLADMVAKGRSGKNKGEWCWQSKLTDLTVAEARALYATGPYTLEQLGLRYGVSFQTMHRVVRGKTWKHLPGAVA